LIFPATHQYRFTAFYSLQSKSSMIFLNSGLNSFSEKVRLWAWYAWYGSQYT